MEARDLHELDVEIPASKKVVVAPGVASESCIEVWDYGAPRDDADGRRQAGIENLLERRGDFCVRQQSGGLDVLLPVCCRIQTIEKKSDVQSFVCLDPTILFAWILQSYRFPVTAGTKQNARRHISPAPNKPINGSVHAHWGGVRHNLYVWQFIFKVILGTTGVRLIRLVTTHPVPSVLAPLAQLG